METRRCIVYKPVDNLWIKNQYFELAHVFTGLQLWINKMLKTLKLNLKVVENIPLKVNNPLFPAGCSDAVGDYLAATT